MFNRLSIVTGCLAGVLTLIAGDAFAGKPPKQPVSTTWPADATLEVSPADAGNRLTWPDFTGIRTFGYDVHYGPDDNGAGNNIDRIKTGARSGFIDEDLSHTNLCNYYIYAYDRGRKHYSDPLRFAGTDNCDSGSGGGGSSGGTGESTIGKVVLHAQETEIPECDSALNADRLNFDQDIAGKFSLAWEEDFDSMDSVRQHFNSAYAWGPETIINNESQYYIDALGAHAGYTWSPFEILSDDSGNGYLAISAAPSDAAGFDSATVNYQPYVSGVLTTRGINDMTYGYYEIRARVAPGNGVWSAFWLNHTNFRNTNEPEIDVIEYLGQSYDADGKPLKATDKHYNTFDTQYHTYWYGARRKVSSPLHYTNRDNTGANPATGIPETREWCGWEVDFSKQYHKYAVKWTPDEIVWYVDDIKVMRIAAGSIDGDMPISDEDMYVILNVAMGSAQNWPGEPDAATLGSFDDNDINRVNMVIDYVRAYRWTGN